MKVFLSHSTKDKQFVQTLAAELEAEKIEPWLCEVGWRRLLRCSRKETGKNRGAEITAQNGNAHGPHGVTRKHVFSDKNVNQILAFVLIQSYFKTSFRYGRIAFKSLTWKRYDASK
jgi:hypothetical protein